MNIAFISPVSPEGSVEIFPPVANVSFGSNITFNCTSQGGPNNQYKWTHLQTGNILSYHPLLTVSSVSFDDGGEYECNVTNEAGDGSDQSVLNSEESLYNNYVCAWSDFIVCVINAL